MLMDKLDRQVMKYKPRCKTISHEAHQAHA